MIDLLDPLFARASSPVHGRYGLPPNCSNRQPHCLCVYFNHRIEPMQKMNLLRLSEVMQTRPVCDRADSP